MALAPDRFIQQRIGVRAVLALAGPIVVSMLSYTAMAVTDTIFVGSLGTVPVAALGIATTGTFLLMSFGNGILSGVKVAIAQRTGSEDHAAARGLAWQGLWLALFLSLPVTAASHLATSLFQLMGAAPDVVRLASDYFSIRVAGAVFGYVFLALSAWFNGRADTRTPMLATLLANLVNIAVDPLLIFGPGPFPALGVDGAAVASVFGFLVGSVFLAWRVWPQLRDTSGSLNRPLLAFAWRIGLPMGTRGGLEVGAWMAFTAFLARIGTVELAAHIIVIRIISLSFLPGYAIGDATAVLVGQAVGARRLDRAGEAWGSALRVAIGFMAVLGVVFVALPAPLLAPFSAEPAVARVATQLLVVAAVFQVFDAVAMASMGALNGAGDTRFVMWTGVLAAWSIKLPIGWWLAVRAGMGARGAWVGLCVEIMMIAVIMSWRWRSGRWASADLRGAG